MAPREPRHCFSSFCTRKEYTPPVSPRSYSIAPNEGLLAHHARAEQFPSRYTTSSHSTPNEHNNTHPSLPPKFWQIDDPGPLSPKGNFLSWPKSVCLAALPLEALRRPWITEGEVTPEIIAKIILVQARVRGHQARRRNCPFPLPLPSPARLSLLILCSEKETTDCR